MTALAQSIRSTYTIKTLSLEWNNIGSSETGMANLFAAIGDNRSLTKVDLRNNEIGAEAGIHIANCLKANQTLQHLDLRWNRLSNAGAKAILKGLGINKTIQSLELNGNKVSEDLMK